MLGNDIAERVLSEAGVKGALWMHFPVVRNLESLAGFEELRLVSLHLNVNGDGTSLGYSATAATEELYQNPVRALEAAEVIRHDAGGPWHIHMDTHHQGMSTESKYVEFTNNNGLELYMEIHKPGYRG